MSAPILKEIPAPRAALCRAILQALPEWFGIPQYVDRYAEETEILPTLGAYVRGDSLVGFLTTQAHNQYTNEIHCMAVLPEYHRKGIGRALVEEAVKRSYAAGFEFLLVKTLGPSKGDPNYERTREFYLKNGFRPLEELHGVWPENPCLIMVRCLRLLSPQ
jgi:GNAT superfamily N-acetyltransferase